MVKREILITGHQNDNNSNAPFMFSARENNVIECAGKYFEQPCKREPTIAVMRNVDACITRAYVRATRERQKRSRQRGQNDHTFTVSLWQWHCPWQGLG
jgi:hypothetical protein